MSIIPNVSKLWPVTACDMINSFLIGLFAREGIDILVSSLMNEIVEPVSNIMCISVPSTIPFTWEMKLSFSVASMFLLTVNGIVISVLPLGGVSVPVQFVIWVRQTSGVSTEVADEHPTSSANGSFPVEICHDLYSHP